LGNVVEGSADIRVLPRWTLGGYLGAIHGGDVIGRTFAGRNLFFGFIESTLQF
jgi:hypothetical protein